MNFTLEKELGIEAYKVDKLNDILGKIAKKNNAVSAMDFINVLPERPKNYVPLPESEGMLTFCSLKIFKLIFEACIILAISLPTAILPFQQERRNLLLHFFFQ